jgi:hypothetical protein
MVENAIRACALGLLLACSGCQGFTNLDFEVQTVTPAETIISFEEMRLVEGRAVGFLARPMSGDTEMGDSTAVSRVSRDPRVADSGPSLEPWSFVLVPVAPGETSLSVIIDGDLEAIIPVRVEVQR